MSPGTPVATLSDSPAEATIQAAVRAADTTHPGLAWWAVRAVHLQQRLLSRNSLSLQRALLHLLSIAATPLGSSLVAPLQPLLQPPAASIGHPDGTALASALSAAFHVEACYTWLDYRHVSLAKEHVAAATRALHLRVSTTGAMGTRTEAQVDAKAQLILCVDRDVVATCGSGSCDCSALGPAGDAAPDVWPQAEQAEGSAWAGWEDDSGVRHVPRLRGPAGAQRRPLQCMQSTCSHISREKVVAPNTTVHAHTTAAAWGGLTPPAPPEPCSTYLHLASLPGKAAPRLTAR